jgi:hypothetical protein
VPFFAVKLSGDGKRLSWGMNPTLRAGIVVALLSVLGMILFSLSSTEYETLSPIGKVNVILIPILLFLGSVYEYRVIFDKANEVVEIRTGLLFLFRRRRRPLDEVQRFVVRTVRPGAKDSGESELAVTGFRRGRVFIGFLISGKMIVLDRACSIRRARGWVAAFRAFMPFEVEEGE